MPATLKLMVQPGAGVAPLVDAINGAKSRVEIVIFRFDRAEIELALAKAAARGVFVHALIAYTNRGGERNLRKLEMRLLAAGITVARTADDLARYHYKFLIVDRRELFLLSFNFTRLDIDHSRCFGLIATDPKLVAEAVKLFEADTKRQPYVPSVPEFVVSPLNARKELTSFIKGAKKELLIYDPEISDPAILRLLESRAPAGVDVKVIGRVKPSSKLAVRKLSIMRLHTRTIIRDGSQAFVGSQSLRELELGNRRELGLIFRHKNIAGQLAKTFREDWEAIERAGEQPAQQPAAVPDEALEVAKVAKKVAKAITKELPPVAPVLRVVVKELTGEAVDIALDTSVVEASVKEAVREAVRDAVESVVEENAAPAVEK